MRRLRKPFGQIKMPFPKKVLHNNLQKMGIDILRGELSHVKDSQDYCNEVLKSDTYGMHTGFYNNPRPFENKEIENDLKVKK